MAPTYILREVAARLYFAGVRVQDLRRTPVPELQRLYVEECRDLPSGGLTALKCDPRAGARAIAEKIERRNHKAQAEGRRLSRLCAFELPLWEQGITLVGGCDEVGMAPLAGPVIAAAVILPAGTRIKGVNDSKLLTPEERDALEPEIRACALAVAIGRAEVEEIDTINIYRAGLLALKRAVLALIPQPQHLLIDARKLDGLSMPQQPIIKGDAKSITIGAASIVAKVHRDRLMARLDGEYPGYGFADHKGYPTPEHLDALERLGACALHRRSFAPVAKKLGLIPEQQELFATPKKRAGEAR
jgi:ribonuclease HII